MEETKVVMDVNAIKKILPHRYPFLLVDKIIAMEEKRVVGLKNVTVNEPFFQGHFPGHPIMPGVLIIEALAQAAGVLALSAPEGKGKIAYFASIDNARFRKPVVPGDQLVLEAEFLRYRSKIVQIRGVAKVNGEVVAEADLMCAIVNPGEGR